MKWFFDKDKGKKLPSTRQHGGKTKVLEKVWEGGKETIPNAKTNCL
jgi:hypothetical protein